MPTICLCVGATKSGTTWLWEQLRLHPQCHFRSIKELHYFNNPSARAMAYRLQATRKEIERLRRQLDSSDDLTQKHLRRQIADRRAWANVLSLQSINTDAYREYLCQGAHRDVVGEATPAYSILTERQLQQLRMLSTKVRIIYLMREPVDRMWSHARMLARWKAGNRDEYAEMARATMEEQLRIDPTFEGRGDYEASLNRLQNVFSRKELLAIFYEDLLSQGGIEAVWNFLEIESVRADIGRKFHEGIELPIDQTQMSKAVIALQRQYEFVSSAFPHLPRNWSVNMRKAGIKG